MNDQVSVFLFFSDMEKSEEEAIARHLSHDLLISSIIVVDDGLDVAAIVKSICPDSGACVCLCSDLCSVERN
jgi:hypothetical protein